MKPLLTLTLLSKLNFTVGAYVKRDFNIVTSCGDWYCVFLKTKRNNIKQTRQFTNYNEERVGMTTH